eukprot:288665-Amphidinium_carterae.1
MVVSNEEYEGLSPPFHGPASRGLLQATGRTHQGAIWRLPDLWWNRARRALQTSPSYKSQDVLYVWKLRYVSPRVWKRNLSAIARNTNAACARPQ